MFMYDKLCKLPSAFAGINLGPPEEISISTTVAVRIHKNLRERRNILLHKELREVISAQRKYEIF